MCRFCKEGDDNIIIRRTVNNNIRIEDAIESEHRIYQIESDRKMRNTTEIFEKTFIIEEVYEKKSIKKLYFSTCHRFYRVDDFLNIEHLHIETLGSNNNSYIDISNLKKLKSLTLTGLLLREIPYLEKLEEVILNNVSIIPKHCFNINLTGLLVLYEIHNKLVRISSMNFKTFSNSCKSLLVLIKAGLPIDMVRMLKTQYLQLLIPTPN